MVIVWQSVPLPGETARDAAGRFVRESFGVERDIKWSGIQGEFRFADGYWCYRVFFYTGKWQVGRLEKQTPAAKARARARRELREGKS